MGAKDLNMHINSYLGINLLVDEYKIKKEDLVLHINSYLGINLLADEYRIKKEDLVLYHKQVLWILDKLDMVKLFV